ncbi:MAG: ribonuclease HI [Treponema sp.]|nr:ribonuclease HI [Treponema sp.]
MSAGKDGPELVIYTDGGCSGNPGPGGWAYVILGPVTETPDGKPGSGLEIRAESSGGEPQTTNNRMELLAVIEALKETKLLLSIVKDNATARISVYTDSQYVQKGITQWIENWKRNAWKTSGKQPVKNRDLWMELDSLSRNLPLDWRWVKGHAGNEYNERCDSMAQNAMKNIV